MNQIILVRHGQSQTNAGLIVPRSIGDHKVQLTELGKQQSVEAGKLLPKDFLVNNGIVYRSPYARARQTCDLFLEGAGYTTRPDRNLIGYRVYEDPRLRELDHGYDDVDEQEAMRREHGWFYYRFKGGESPADCYDRCCTFLESLTRQVSRKSYRTDGIKRYPNVLIITHGISIRCFVMRFMHLSVEQFEMLGNNKNCDLVRIAKKEAIENPQFVSGRWGVEGLVLRDKPRDSNF